MRERSGSHLSLLQVTLAASPGTVHQSTARTNQELPDDGAFPEQGSARGVFSPLSAARNDRAKPTVGRFQTDQGNGVMQQQRVQEFEASSSHAFNPSPRSEEEDALPRHR